MTNLAAAEKLAGHGSAKKDEKVEKRRALGRGLESLLPGPRVVVAGTESRVAGTEQSPQGLKPESFSATSGTLRPGSGQAPEAVPFPITVDAGSGGGVGEQQIPRFARNDNEVGIRSDSVGGPKASEEMEATRAGAPAPHLHEPDEVISIQAVADDHIVGNRVVYLSLEVIEKNPFQTRYVFDEDMLRELTDSIKEHGVVQPVVVRPGEEEGRYILVLGERRLRASKLAGKDTIPALVRRLAPQQAAEMTVLENVVREDLNPIEQAEAFRVLSTEFKLTQAQIADRIGVSRETVANYMRLLRLPKKVMEYMLGDRLSFSDAREILRLENDEYIEQVAEEVVTHKLKWDQIEDRVMRINGYFPMLPGQTMPGEAKKRSGGARWVDPNVRAAQLELERLLGVRVRIRDRKGKGKIVIEYHTVDDYDRVVDALRGKK
jgi:ParB family transcriptional regulator, chromosome partitioning protein